MDISLCLNHSDQPNLISIEDGAYFEAIRDIAANEELTIDYGTICDSKE
ncbi:MAG: SET domain-containing protein-lysine N-methyltransferase [Saprospiraceae bacterium]|nr:SET domain-containing protein-lysine N-methyltransferase [Saprospiraceae bacterium]